MWMKVWTLAQAGKWQRWDQESVGLIKFAGFVPYILTLPFCLAVSSARAWATVKLQSNRNHKETLKDLKGTNTKWLIILASCSAETPILFLLTQRVWQLMLSPARKPYNPSRTGITKHFHSLSLHRRRLRRFSWPCHFNFSSMEHWSLKHAGCHLPIIDKCNLEKTDLLKQKLKGCWKQCPAKTKAGNSNVSTALGIRHAVFSVEIFHAHLHLCVCSFCAGKVTSFIRHSRCYDANRPQHKLNERVQSTSTY